MRNEKFENWRERSATWCGLFGTIVLFVFIIFGNENYGIALTLETLITFFHSKNAELDEMCARAVVVRKIGIFGRLNLENCDTEFRK